MATQEELSALSTVVPTRLPEGGNKQPWYTIEANGQGWWTNGECAWYHYGHAPFGYLTTNPRPANVDASAALAEIRKRANAATRLVEEVIKERLPIGHEHYLLGRRTYADEKGLLRIHVSEVYAGSILDHCRELRGSSPINAIAGFTRSGETIALVMPRMPPRSMAGIREPKFLMMRELKEEAVRALKEAKAKV